MFAALIPYAQRRLVWPDESADPSPPRWYESIWLWLAMALLSVLPFIVSSHPPIVDLNNHMGRYHVMLERAHSPFLQRYYSFSWDLIPNLGQDLLMVPIGTLFGVERGAMILTAAIPAAMILGFRSLSLAVHGRVQPVALLALPYAMGFIFLYGFVNYYTGLVLVVWAAVFWYRARSWRAAPRIVVLTILSMIAWLCHFSAWAALLTVIGSLELAASIRSLGWRPGHIVATVMTTMGPMLLPIVITLSRMSELGLDHEPMGKFIWKVNSMASPLRDQSKIFDVASVAFIAAVPTVLLLRGKLRFDAGLGLATLVMFGLYLTIPFELMRSLYADIRLLPVVWFCGLIACRMEAPPRWSNAVALLAVMLFTGRMAVTTQGWIARGASLEAELGALRYVPQGARIAELSPMRQCGTWPSLGLHHLSSMAIVRRDAFTSTQWATPGAQPMQPIYLAGSAYNSVETLKGDDGKVGCSGRSLDDWLGKLPRESFDFVWLFTVEAPPSTRSWLTPVFKGPQGTLYAVRHGH